MRKRGRDSAEHPHNLKTVEGLERRGFVILCKVIGTVVSQQKEECLVGKKLLLCETRDTRSKRVIVAVDLVGAGPGSDVLVSRHYQNSRGDGDYVDDRIIGIVDSVTEQQ